MFTNIYLKFLIILLLIYSLTLRLETIWNIHNLIEIFKLFFALKLDNYMLVLACKIGKNFGINSTDYKGTK